MDIPRQTEGDVVEIEADPFVVPVGDSELPVAALLAAHREAPTELTSRPAIRHIALDLITCHPQLTGARQLRTVLRPWVNGHAPKEPIASTHRPRRGPLLLKDSA